jgi:hypothetical protein
VAHCDGLSRRSGSGEYRSRTSVSLSFVTGYVRASAEPSRTLSGDAPTLVGLGDRHAARAGSTVALCGRPLAHIEPDMPFGVGGLGARACMPCAAAADEV